MNRGLKHKPKPCLLEKVKKISQLFKGAILELGTRQREVRRLLLVEKVWSSTSQENRTYFIIKPLKRLEVVAHHTLRSFPNIFICSKWNVFGATSSCILKQQIIMSQSENSNQKMFKIKNLEKNYWKWKLFPRETQQSNFYKNQKSKCLNWPKCKAY